MNFKSTFRMKLLIVGMILAFVGLGTLTGCYSRTYYSQQPTRYADDGYADYDAPYYANQQPDWYDDNYYYFNGANGYRRVPRTRITYNISIDRVPRVDESRRQELNSRMMRRDAQQTTNPVQQNQQQYGGGVTQRPNSTPLPSSNPTTRQQPPTGGVTQRPGVNPIQRSTPPPQVQRQQSSTVTSRPPTVPMSRPTGGVTKRP